MFQHPDAQALYRAVLANPDDDAPRLILADWLDENGEPERAEYIRLACAIERDKWSDESFDNRIRLGNLWSTLGREWLAELPQLPNITWGHFSRGLCSEAITNNSVSKEHFNTAISIAPITSIYANCDRSIHSIASSRIADQIRDIRIGESNSTITDITTLSFFKSTKETPLRSIHIPISKLTKKAIQSLLECRQWNSLTSLSLSCNHHQNGYLHLLDDSELLPSLNDVSLTDAEQLNIEPNIVKYSNLGKRLSRFAMRKRTIIDPTKLLAEAFFTQHMRRLDVNLIDWSLFRRIFQSPNLTGLRELTVNVNCYINANRMADVTSFRGLCNLRSLAITNFQGDPNILLPIVTSPFVFHLRMLTFLDTPITEKVARAMIGSPYLVNLNCVRINLANLSEAVKAKIIKRFIT